MLALETVWTSDVIEDVAQYLTSRYAGGAEIFARRRSEMFEQLGEPADALRWRRVAKRAAMIWNARSPTRAPKVIQIASHVA
jgi:hypothetical protein